MTHYERLAVSNGYSLVELHLDTGRTHQIRVHMKYIGCPLPGDFLYHPVFDRISRQALHSFQLEFAHPITKEPMRFLAPVPEDFRKAFANEALKSSSHKQTAEYVITIAAHRQLFYHFCYLFIFFVDHKQVP